MRKEEEEEGQQLQQQGGALQLAKPARTRRSSPPKNRGKGEEGEWGDPREGRADLSSASFQESSDPGSMNGGWHASSSYY
jgi:hypothetical protein